MNGRPSSTVLFEQIEILLPAVRAQLAKKNTTGQSWDSLEPWLVELEQVVAELSSLREHVDQRTLRKKRGALENELEAVFGSIRQALHYKMGRGYRPDYPLKRKGVKNVVCYRQFYEYWRSVDVKIITFFEENDGLSLEEIGEKVSALEEVVEKQAQEDGYLVGLTRLSAVKHILMETLVLLGVSKFEVEGMIR